jgi:putative methyltransferase (TIGR04325 family)
MILSALLGYNRPFATLQDATAAIAGYDDGGHSNAGYIAVTTSDVERPLPGDHAALYHLQTVITNIHKVFDVGGSVGNLLYRYTNYLEFPLDLNWTVFDLVETNGLGERIAISKNERRLRFTDRFLDANGTDLLISCGSLHYFEPPLWEMVAGLSARPRYILINRAPLVDVPTFATVQDGGRYRLACILYNRNNVIEGFERLGYELVESWEIPGLSVIVPGYPDRSALSYSGCFLRIGSSTRGWRPGLARATAR